jgi:hypothetical protein
LDSDRGTSINRSWPFSNSQKHPTNANQPDLRAPTLQAEIDSYYEAMALFGQMDLGEILMRLAAISARASGVRSQVVRTESRRMAAFRSRELDPLIEEVDRQFKIWSRLQSVRSMEWDMSRGGA